MKFGLKEKTIEQINQILAGYPQIKKAIIYGSRAKGNFKTGSDIDITIEGRELNLKLLNKVKRWLMRVEQLRVIPERKLSKRLEKKL